jgi:IS1 family transposase
MTVYDRMESIISAFALYDTETNKFLKGELKAFAVGLEYLWDMLKTMERECFVATARDYGLTEKEEIFGSPKSDRAVYDRRNMLISALSLSNSDFTLEGMNSYLNIFPTTHDIFETPSKNAVTVNFENNSWVRTNLEALKKAVEKFFPAHLDVTVSATGLMWSEAESKVSSFNYFDSRCYNWTQIEALE